MVKTVKLERRKFRQNQFSFSEYKRIRNWDRSYYGDTPPPPGGSPVFNTPFVDGNIVWQPQNTCTIVAGRLTCDDDIFDIFTLPRFDIIDDGCNYGIMLTFPWIYGTKKSFFSYWRTKNCKKDEEVTEYEYTFTPPDACEDDERALYIWLWVDFMEYEDFRHFHDSRDAAGHSYQTTQTDIVKVEFPDDEYQEYGGRGLQKVYAKVTVKLTIRWEANKVIQEIIGWDELFFGDKTVLEDTYERVIPIFDFESRKELAIDNGEGTAGYAYRDYDRFIRESRKTYQEIVYAFDQSGLYDNIVSVSFDESPIEVSTKTKFRTFRNRFITEVVDFFGFRYFVYESSGMQFCSDCMFIIPIQFSISTEKPGFYFI